MWEDGDCRGDMFEIFVVFGNSSTCEEGGDDGGLADICMA